LSSSTVINRFEISLYPAIFHPVQPQFMNDLNTGSMPITNKVTIKMKVIIF